MYLFVFDVESTELLPSRVFHNEVALLFLFVQMQGLVFEDVGVIETLDCQKVPSKENGLLLIKTKGFNGIDFVGES